MRVPMKREELELSVGFLFFQQSPINVTSGFADETDEVYNNAENRGTASGSFDGCDFQENIFSPVDIYIYIYCGYIKMISILPYRQQLTFILISKNKNKKCHCYGTRRKKD